MKFELAEWSSKIEVGLPEIDAQHRQLFELAATFAGDGEQIRVLKSLAMLTEYVKVHLREEEEMMAACRYPVWKHTSACTPSSVECSSTCSRTPSR